MITRESFGRTPEGSEVYLYTLSNNSKVSAKITNFGGIIQGLFVEGKDGVVRDVVCGFDSIDGYLNAGGYQGAIIGRIANRIRKAQFSLDGVEYHLAANCDDYCAHGGNIGFNRRVWGTKAVDGDEPELILTYVSPDMEENFPGTMVVTVTYKLLAVGGLSIRYEAYTDKRTIINLTNHAYFNLEGFETQNLEGQVMWIDADKITEHGYDIVPTGNILDITGTAYDFMEPKPLLRDFDSDPDMDKQHGGYDNNFIFRNYDGSMKKRAYLEAPVSGIKMDVYTNQPCVGVYTANMIDEDDVPFKGGVQEKRRCSVCFETQKMPDSCNHPNFTDTTLDVGDTYDYTTIFMFN